MCSGTALASASADSGTRERRVPEDHQPWWRGLPARARTTRLRSSDPTTGRMPAEPWAGATGTATAAGAGQRSESPRTLRAGDISTRRLGRYDMGGVRTAAATAKHHSRVARARGSPTMVAWASSPRRDHSPSEQRPHDGQDARRARRTMGRSDRDSDSCSGRGSGSGRNGTGTVSGSGSDEVVPEHHGAVPVSRRSRSGRGHAGASSAVTGSATHPPSELQVRTNENRYTSHQKQFLEDAWASRTCGKCRSVTS
jgi:hypothetical protein